MLTNYDKIHGTRDRNQRKAIRVIRKAGKPVEWRELVASVYGTGHEAIRDRRFQNEDVQAMVASGALAISWNDYGDSFLSVA